MTRTITGTVDGVVIDVSEAGGVLRASIHSATYTRRTHDGPALPEWWIDLYGVPAVGWRDATISIATVHGGIGATLEATTPRLEPELLDTWGVVTAAAIALRSDDAGALPDAEQLAGYLERAARQAAELCERGAP